MLAINKEEHRALLFFYYSCIHVCIELMVVKNSIKSSLETVK